MEELKNRLIDVLNSFQMPLDAKYYVVKDLYRDMNEYYYSELNKLKGSENNVAELASPVMANVDKQALDSNTDKSD